QGSQQHEHHQNGQAHQDTRLTGSLTFLVGQTGPVHAKTARQLLHQVFHLDHGFTRGVAWSGTTTDTNGLVAVVAHDLYRTLFRCLVHKGGQRNHLAFAVASIQLEHIINGHAVWRISLYPDTLHTALVGKFTHEGRAQSAANQGRGFAEVHTQGR